MVGTEKLMNVEVKAPVTMSNNQVLEENNSTAKDAINQEKDDKASFKFTPFDIPIDEEVPNGAVSGLSGVPSIGGGLGTPDLLKFKLDTKKIEENAEQTFANIYFKGNVKEAQEFISKGGDLNEVPVWVKDTARAKVDNLLKDMLGYYNEAEKKDAPQMQIPQLDDKTNIMLVAGMADAAAQAIAGIAGGTAGYARATTAPSTNQTMAEAGAMLMSDVEKYKAKKDRVDEINFRLRVEHGEKLEALREARAKLLTQGEELYIKMENEYLNNRLTSYEKMIGLKSELDLKSQEINLKVETANVGTGNQFKMTKAQMAQQASIARANMMQNLAIADARMKQSATQHKQVMMKDFLVKSSAGGSFYNIPEATKIDTYQRMSLPNSKDAPAIGNHVYRIWQGFSNYAGKTYGVADTKKSNDLMHNLSMYMKMGYVPKQLDDDTLAKIAKLQPETVDMKVSGKKEDLDLFRPIHPNDEAAQRLGNYMAATLWAQLPHEKTLGKDND